MSTSAFNRKRSTEAGFTLVEIAIVLVIIGLLLGGILKGQEMITQARIKNAINDFNGITVAVTSYQDRYRFLPGDDKGATARWTVQAPASGDGDGVIVGKYSATSSNPPAAGEESNLFWQHLRIAGFVPGETTGVASGTQPRNAVGGIIGVEAATATTGLGFTGLIVCSSNIPDKVAIAIDTQADDSSSATGQIRAQSQTSAAPPPTVQNPASGYVETGVGAYLVCKTF
jgi:prepilin-type N-terminal cleavage/methylation domain-containing protein